MKRTHRALASDRGAGRGFTLIELLVVVAVIALMLAILLPSLSAARALAKRLRCGGNLKQLALASDMYVTDSDYKFFQGINANVSYGGWQGIKGWWPRPLNAYVGFGDANDVTQERAKIFRCPGDRGGIPGAFLRMEAYEVHGTSYQTNIFLIGQDSCRPFSDATEELDLAIAARLPNLTRSQVTANPSRLLLMGDYGWINQWKPAAYPDPEWKSLAEWHGKADCHSMAFLDGHVTFLKIQKGYYVADDYWVLPFADLAELARRVQGPEE